MKQNQPEELKSKEWDTPNSEKEQKSQVSYLEELMSEVIKILNPESNKEIKAKSPLRYAKAMLELTQSNRLCNENPCSDAIFDSEGFNDLIIVKGINFTSICEHHILPFFGECTIGYIPNQSILGLSKFSRLVEYLSRKMHNQERLTMEIAEAINSSLNPLGVVVTLTSTHSCMCFRGVRSVNSKTETIFTIGQMRMKEHLDKFFKLKN
jgi:GTP cyclohydrolase I